MLPELASRRNKKDWLLRDIQVKVSIPVRGITISPRSGGSLADYRTDYIAAGRAWTPLDDVSPKTANSRAIWTTLDESGHRAACSKTAGCRFDSCPTCPVSA